MDNPFKKFAEEWKKATPKEKLMIVGAGASIVAIALYLHHKTSSSAPGTGLAGLPSSLSPASSTGSTGTTGTTGTTGSTGSTDTGSFSAPTTDPYAPPVYTGTGSTPATVDTSAPATNYVTQAGSVLSGTFGRNTTTQAAHRGATPLNLPAYSPGAAVLGGTFGRTSATQNAHRGTGSTPSTPPQTAPSTGGNYGQSTPQPTYPIGGYAKSQPTSTTQVYAAARHAPAVVPISSQQVVRPGQKGIG